MIKFLNDPNSLKLDFYYSIVKELLGTLDCQFSMTAMRSACCCIDYMSVPLADPNRNTRQHFKKFIAEYMSAANNKYLDSTLQDEIYAIRCSLVHTYGEADATNKLSLEPIFQIQSFPNHLEKHKDENDVERFYISIPHFVSEVVVGIEKFFRECTDTALLSRWYKKLIIVTGMAGGFAKLGYIHNGNKIVHSQIHPFISCFDSNETDYMKLSNNISEAFLRKHNYWIE